MGGHKHKGIKGIGGFLLPVLLFAGVVRVVRKLFVRYLLVTLCWSLCLGALLGSLLVAPKASAQLRAGDPWGFSVGGKFGIPLEVGGEIAWDIISYSRVRLGGGYGNSEVEFDEGRGLVNGSSKLRREEPWVALLLDTYPFQRELLGEGNLEFLNNVRVTAGFGWFGYNAGTKKDMRPGEELNVGDTNHTVGDNGLELSTNITNAWTVSPIIGIGFETNREKGFVFNADLNIIFLGGPEVNYELNWHGNSNVDSDLEKALGKEKTKLQNSIKENWDWWEISFLLGVGWHF